MIHGTQQVVLSAEMGFDYTSHNDTAMKVIVSFGNVTVAVLEPCRSSRAGHGDDSSFFRDEEESIVAETVAPYLARIFESEAAS